MVMIGAAAVEGVIQAEGHLIVWGRVVLRRVDACRLERLMVSMSAEQDLNISSADFKSPLRMVSHACGLQHSRGGGMDGLDSQVCVQKGDVVTCGAGSRGPSLAREQCPLPTAPCPAKGPTGTCTGKRTQKCVLVLPHAYCRLQARSAGESKDVTLARASACHRSRGKALVHRVVSTY